MLFFYVDYILPCIFKSYYPICCFYVCTLGPNLVCSHATETTCYRCCEWVEYRHTHTHTHTHTCTPHKHTHARTHTHTHARTHTHTHTRTQSSCSCFHSNLPLQDALYLLCQEPELVKGYERAILTPNVIELQRLYRAVFKEDIPNVHTMDWAVQNLAKSLGGVTIVLKGEEDIITNGIDGETGITSTSQACCTQFHFCNPTFP